MCQYTDDCPTGKHREETVCPVMHRKKQQNARFISSMVILGLGIVAILLYTKTDLLPF